MILYFRIVMGSLDLLLAAIMLWLCLQTIRHGLPAEPSARRRTAGNLLIAVAGGIMVMSGSLKFLQLQHVVAEMTLLQLGGWKLQLVAALEVASGLLLLARPLRSIGLAVASAYLGAAICAHVQVDQFFAVLPTMLILGSAWLGAALRHPQLLWSLAELSPGRRLPWHRGPSSQPARVLQ